MFYFPMHRSRGTILIRIDKYLAECNIGSRSQVKEFLRKGMVTVNGDVVKKSDLKINETEDRICFQETLISYQRYYYYMLHKPAGVVTATKDNVNETVMDICKDIYRADLFPVGRLDKDTEGLLLLTNDGQLSHRILSPKRHVEKTYFAKIDHAFLDADIKALEQGVDIGEAKNTLPAKIKQGETPLEVYITIVEGKFHQIKRMLEAVQNKVIYLKRISMGGISLDELLAPGEYRELSEAEVTKLQNIGR